MVKKFGYFLDELIKISGLEKKEIASRAGITASYITGLTSGRNRPPSFVLIRRISKILSLSKEDESELLYLASQERAPMVVDYLTSPEGIQTLKEKKEENFRDSIDLDIQEYLDTAKKFFGSKKISEERKELIQSTMESDLKLYEESEGGEREDG